MRTREAVEEDIHWKINNIIWNQWVRQSNPRRHISRIPGAEGWEYDEDDYAHYKRKRARIDIELMPDFARLTVQFYEVTGFGRGRSMRGFILRFRYDAPTKAIHEMIDRVNEESYLKCRADPLINSEKEVE